MSKSNLVFSIDSRIGKKNATTALAEDPLVGIRQAALWQNAWMAAIAMAWASDTDKAALLANAPQFFKDKCGWEVPDGLDLKVTDLPKVDEDNNPLGWDAMLKQWELARTRVTMYLPPKPAVEQQAVALANYLATGRAYPFTTC